MPRKVDPRWGDDGWFEGSQFVLEADDAEELFTILGELTVSQKVDIRSEIEEIVSDFERWLAKDEHGPTRAEACKALKLISSKGDFSAACLQTLNSRAFESLLDALVTHRDAAAWQSKHRSVFKALLADEIPDTAICEAIEDAIQALQARKGQDRPGNLFQTIARLCEVYQGVTGNPPTAWSEDETNPSSEAGKFICVCLRHSIYKDGRVLTERRIGRVLRAYVSSLKA